MTAGGGAQGNPLSSAWVSGLWRLEAELGWGGLGTRGPGGAPPGSPRQHTGVGAAAAAGLQWGPEWAFPEGWVSPQSHKNPTGGISVWVAVILKGFRSHSLEGASPAPTK